MTEENIDNEQSSDKNTDPSTTSEQEMKKILESVPHVAPSNEIKEDT
jgi:hypothetical protein